VGCNAAHGSVARRVEDGKAILHRRAVINHDLVKVGLCPVRNAEDVDIVDLFEGVNSRFVVCRLNLA
jgi:hypothetical protein